MLHVFDEPQLPEGPFGERLGLKRSVELLDRHFGSCSGVQRITEKQGRENQTQKYD